MKSADIATLDAWIKIGAVQHARPRQKVMLRKVSSILQEDNSRVTLWPPMSFTQRSRRGVSFPCFEPVRSHFLHTGKWLMLTSMPSVLPDILSVQTERQETISHDFSVQGALHTWDLRHKVGQKPHKKKILFLSIQKKRI